MSQALLHAQAQKFKRPFPELRPGYTVRVHQKIQEGDKERIQVFEGLILAFRGGRTLTDATFIVRRVVEGVGVEKIFSLCSPTITKIDIVKVARVRRAKLFFLRGRRGKAARLSERFTTAGEFAVAVAEPKKEETEEASEEAPKAVGEKEGEEAKEQETSKDAKVESKKTDLEEPKDADLKEKGEEKGIEQK